MQIYMRNKNIGGMELVKENAGDGGAVRLRWVCAAALGTALALLGAALADRRLPAALDRSAPPQRFIAQIAHEHLVNITAIGPRVAGSYENEVAAVRVLLGAARALAAHASPHNRVDYDVFTASGAFALTFLDGMSNVYRDVQSVLLRVRGAGGRAGAARRALLLNCHFDTVPDSPGSHSQAPATTRRAAPWRWRRRARWRPARRCATTCCCCSTAPRRTSCRRRTPSSRATPGRGRCARSSTSRRAARAAARCCSRPARTTPGSWRCTRARCRTRSRRPWRRSCSRAGSSPPTPTSASSATTGTCRAWTWRGAATATCTTRRWTRRSACRRARCSAPATTCWRWCAACWPARGSSRRRRRPSSPCSSTCWACWWCRRARPPPPPCCCSCCCCSPLSSRCRPGMPPGNVCNTRLTAVC